MVVPEMRDRLLAVLGFYLFGVRHGKQAWPAFAVRFALFTSRQIA
jgi:hypothetical protein